MATATASSYLREPKALHSGVNKVIGTYTATLGIGDVLKCFRLPDRAIITDAGVQHDGGGGDLTMQIRSRSDSASTTVAQALVTATGSGVVRMSLAAGFGYQVSLSDAVVVKDVDIEIANASAASTGVHRFWIEYVLDNLP